ncbi:MAG: bifunctional 23S rRNA (guanine(2069)-N(7))-methyltransferase RlmK/23S rRNA (guanine(2445)-N(2))-methyltransferase RlmL [Spirochaetia bacterium]|nr:bifunctional 23S rRNA (guanine(2069)-N(7))-methyltransferase RlmK/23S rRNA (guanine(2445)-N(2))-methyltransferase RlmL [Spirochaetia bacterium]
MELFNFTVTSANGYENLIAKELEALGIRKYTMGQGNVSFRGTQKDGLKVCLWSRVASKVLLNLMEFTVKNEKDIYKNVVNYDWDSIFSLSRTFAVDTVLATANFRNNAYLSLVVKDGIADSFRKKTGKRPDVETEQPDIRINFFINRDRGTVSLDMAGDSLHRRGYRIAHVEAPLKENAAAALLYRGNWQDVAASGGSFIDPMCGSGTLVIESVMMAANIPPAFDRNYFCFKNWRKFNRNLWEEIRQEATELITQSIPSVPNVFGFDYSTDSVNAARKNVSKAFSMYPELLDKIRISKKEIHKLSIPDNAGAPGLIGVNPPYGERLGEKEQLKQLYADMGNIFKERFNGWKGFFITGDQELARKTGLKATKVNKLYNGPLECISAVFSLDPEYREEHEHELSPAAQMFANRIAKNLKLMRKTARRLGVTSYRIYDADMPDYSAAIDFYEDKWIYLQEYAAPAYIDPTKTKRRIKEMEQVLTQYTDRENIFIRRREKQHGAMQYEKNSNTGKFEIMQENGIKFYVNFYDYLDTGIFLDHRDVRSLIKQESQGKKFLNLFAYTCTASIYAVTGGAVKAVSVDTSSTYLDWGQRNFQLNGLNPKEHDFIKCDSIEFLQKNQQKFDLIFIDPPTFSNSKSRENIFDIQRDHASLLRLAGNSLNNGGKIIFSTNSRKFELDDSLSESFNVEDITKSSIPFDYARNTKIHKCWILTRN